MNMKHFDVWNDYCNRFHVYDDAKPLLETDDDFVVNTMEFRDTLVLKRSTEVDEMIGKHRELLLADVKNKESIYDGLIYILLWRSDDSDVIPIYIGIAESVGTRQPISGNIKSRDAWCRWGYVKDWHLGRLSEVVLRNDSQTSQEAKWAKRCFHSDSRKLNRQLYLWTMPWPRSGIGVWEDFGSTPLPLLEMTLVNVAWVCFPDILSNVKGVPRR